MELLLSQFQGGMVQTTLCKRSGRDLRLPQITNSHFTVSTERFLQERLEKNLFSSIYWFGGFAFDHMKYNLTPLFVLYFAKA